MGREGLEGFFFRGDGESTSANSSRAESGWVIFSSPCLSSSPASITPRHTKPQVRGGIDQLWDSRCDSDSLTACNNTIPVLTRDTEDTKGHFRFDRLERMRWIKCFKTHVALFDADTRGN